MRNPSALSVARGRMGNEERTRFSAIVAEDRFSITLSQAPSATARSPRSTESGDASGPSARPGCLALPFRFPGRSPPETRLGITEEPRVARASVERAAAKRPPKRIP